MTLTEEFAQLLDDLGFGTYSPTDGGTVFLNALPPSPDDAIAVARYDTGGADSRLPYDDVDVQFRVRAADPATAEQAAQAIRDQFLGLGMRALPGGTWLQLALIKSGPIYLGRDANGRHEYSVNVRAEVGRPTPHRV